MSDINKPAQPKRYDSHTQAFQIDHKTCIPRKDVEERIQRWFILLGRNRDNYSPETVDLIQDILNDFKKLLENNG